MATYKIVGVDGKEYGPITADILKQWIAQGRVNALTQVLAEGAADWKTLGEIPELAAALGTAPPPPLAGSLAGQGGSPLPSDVRERGYNLDLGECVGRAWAMLTGPRMWLVIGGVAIWLLIQAGLSGFAQIPFIGLLFSLASLVIGGPLMGGVFHFLLRCLRGEPAEVGNIFDGFRYRFGQLFLGQIVPALLTFVSILPGLVLVAAGLFPLFSDRGIAGLGIALIAIGSLVMLVPAIYLSVSWLLVLPLIMDKRLDFWSAMQLSRAVVGQHWWTILLVMLLIGILNGIGILLCCIGLFFTMPLGFVFAMCCYEKMFSPSPGVPAPTSL